jgi:hypothetical protein
MNFWRFVRISAEVLAAILFRGLTKSKVAEFYPEILGEKNIFELQIQMRDLPKLVHAMDSLQYVIEQGVSYSLIKCTLALH